MAAATKKGRAKPDRGRNSYTFQYFAQPIVLGGVPPGGEPIGHAVQQQGQQDTGHGIHHRMLFEQQGGSHNGGHQQVGSRPADPAYRQAAAAQMQADTTQRGKLFCGLGATLGLLAAVALF